MSIVAAPAISVVGSAKGESGPAAGSIAVVAGGVISETTGTLLVASGKVVAFIPSELGEALLSQKRLPAS